MEFSNPIKSLVYDHLPCWLSSCYCDILSIIVIFLSAYFSHILFIYPSYSFNVFIIHFDPFIFLLVGFYLLFIAYWLCIMVAYHLSLSCLRIFFHSFVLCSHYFIFLLIFIITFSLFCCVHFRHFCLMCV